ncbi:hypothetical protein XCV1923 [Xanthomonas euvesicatoria pv. vesicatoria str. 85-10]|uniref:Uncharacterized protein n=1 Tax=Xanthomonas euvesicatoria pv. vesicatoria (strain 85-10) TaxID=316273 RepID=Q3BUA9_XANE5|nr:hypothetical protein XCV1923 [Xanthomonas euvesicatoria pv. vesicatoria str. 85-10]
MGAGGALTAPMQWNAAAAWCGRTHGARAWMGGREASGRSAHRPVTPLRCDKVEGGPPAGCRWLGNTACCRLLLRQISRW